MAKFSPTTSIKKEIIKVSGALIRVVNDKFEPALKVEIFRALESIQIKGGIALKPMVPQLQTTFIKALGSPDSTNQMIHEVKKNIILLIKVTPRIDNIVKDLNKIMVKGSTNQDVILVTTEILTYIARAYAKKISAPVKESLVSEINNLIDEDADDEFSIKL